MIIFSPPILNLLPRFQIFPKICISFIFPSPFSIIVKQSLDFDRIVPDRTLMNLAYHFYLFGISSFIFSSHKQFHCHSTQKQPIYIVFSRTILTFCLYSAYTDSQTIFYFWHYFTLSRLHAAISILSCFGNIISSSMRKQELSHSTPDERRF